MIRVLLLFDEGRVGIRGGCIDDIIVVYGNNGRRRRKVFEVVQIRIPCRFACYCFPIDVIMLIVRGVVCRRRRSVTG
jgi:hypothetical protein